MGRIISIHEYDLKPGVDLQQFEQALRDAEARGLPQLPGLMAHHFVKGARGVSAAAPMLPCGSMRVGRLGSACGAAQNGLAGRRTIRIPGRCGRTNFWLRF
jgi:hypothetical protein